MSSPRLSTPMSREHVWSADMIAVRAFVADIVDELRRETLDEGAPSGACHNSLEIARDLGYRAGHNDRARSMVRLLEVKAGIR